MANADPDTVTWTGMVAGKMPRDKEDAKNGGLCEITGAWYPGSWLKTVNGKRIRRDIPIVPSNYPSYNEE